MKIEQNIRPWQIVKIRFTKMLVYTWFWDRFKDCLILEFKYWKYIAFGNVKIKSQVRSVRPFGIWAGFMSEGRGLRWDRKSRYGIK